MEIRYEGAVIGRATEISGSSEAGDLVLVMNEPMPVGTRLELISGDEVAFVRVVKVREGTDSAPAGMSVRTVSASEPLEVLGVSAVDEEDLPAAALASPPPGQRADEDSSSSPSSSGNGASGANGHFTVPTVVEGGSSAEMQAVGGKKRRRRRR